jgi:hypothetical protein
MSEYNIRDLFTAAFGDQHRYQPVLAHKDLEGALTDYKGVKTWVGDEELHTTSRLGTPIMMPVRFEAVEDYFTSGFNLPPATLIEFQQSKEIVTTKVTGRNGTIKEYIGLDDWQITIKGIIIDDDAPKLYPENIVRYLNRIKEAPVSIPITNKICEILKIYQIVIKDLSLPATEAFPGVQAFIITAMSDAPFEIKELNNFPDNY